MIAAVINIFFDCHHDDRFDWFDHLHRRDSGSASAVIGDGILMLAYILMIGY